MLAKPTKNWLQRAMNGAVAGLLIGILALVAALALTALSDRHESESRLRMSRSVMALYYVVGGTGLGGLAGLLSTWLHGRGGRTTVGIIVTAIGGVLILPLWMGPITHWGGAEVLTVVLVSVVLGPLLAGRSASQDDATDL